MTVLDEIRGQVTARLRELAPLVSEFEELKAVAARLDIDVDAVAADARPAPARRRSRRPATAPRSDTKAIGAQRRLDVLALIRERPGLTVAQLSERLAVDRTGLYRVIRRLEAEGLVRKDGATLRPAA